MALRLGAAMVAGLVTATMSLAQEAVPVESGVNGTMTVTLHLHPFLTPEEVSTLRLVLTNDQALALFVPQTSGYAAFAVSPDDGFVRDAAVVASAQALADLPDAQAARDAAIAACDALRTGAAPCVVVLDIAPVS